MREFALTRLSWRGSTRGTAAARVTPYALDATRQPSAAGNSATESPERTASARTQHRNARSAIVAPIAHRRPWLKRSRNGPISGRDDRERQHRQAEEQRDLPAGLVGRDLEEQRAGQRDRHRRVAGAVERVQLDQPGQAAVPGPLGVRGATGLAQGVARGPTGAGPGPAGPPGGGLRGATSAPGHGPSAHPGPGAAGQLLGVGVRVGARPRAPADRVAGVPAVLGPHVPILPGDTVWSRRTPRGDIGARVKEQSRT